MAQRPVDTLVTHSGSFHTDDLLAYAVLSALHPEARLVRTRDTQVLAVADDSAIVFDVGFLYAPESNRYDHHEPDRPRRPEGLAYSSFGLIWRYLGRDYIAATLGLDGTMAGETVEQIHAELDAGVVWDIDAVDNGELAVGQDALMHPLSLLNLFSTFRPAFDQDEPGRGDSALAEELQLLGSSCRRSSRALGPPSGRAPSLPVLSPAACIRTGSSYPAPWTTLSLF